MAKKKYKVGYTTGVFDLFHIGHLNLIKNAKEQCDHLICGVTTDEEVERVKKKKPAIPFEERIEIVKALKYVDLAVPEENTDKLEAWKRYKFDAIFKGDDWAGTPLWKRYGEEFKKLGVAIVFFPYTVGTSSTLLKEALEVLEKIMV